MSYRPLWQTVKTKGITAYALRNHFGIGGGTIERLQNNEPVSTTTLDRLCNVLNCKVQDILEFIPDNKDDIGEKPSK